MGAKRSVLDRPAQKVLLRQLGTLRENVQRCYERIGPTFLSALAPLLDFRRAFCELDSERTLLSMYWVESAMEKLCNPKGQGGPLFAPASGGYVSDWLQARRLQRDKQFSDVAASIRAQPWLAEYDPASRRYAELMYTSNAEVQERRKPFKAKMLKARVAEKQAVDTHRYDSADTSAMALVRRYLEGHEAVIKGGFQFDDAASNTESICFSRLISDGWKLVLHVSTAALGRPPYGETESGYIGDIDMPLVLQREHVVGWPEKALFRDAMQIQYEAILQDFELAYRGFADAGDVCVLLNARLRVLESTDFLRAHDEIWAKQLTSIG